MTVDKSDKSLRGFLVELEALSRKYGMTIGGCGCCGSPWIDRETPLGDERAGYTTEDGNRLAWISPLDKYDWEHDGDKVVK